VPIIEEDDNGRRTVSHEADYRDLNEEAFFEELIYLADIEASNIPIFEVYMKYFGHGTPDFKPICLTSLIDPEYDRVIGLEDMAEHYHVLPEAGGWNDQTNMLVEAFGCIRSAKIQYDRVYADKVAAKYSKR